MCAEKEIVLCTATNARSESMKPGKQRVPQKRAGPGAGVTGHEG